MLRIMSDRAARFASLACALLLAACGTTERVRALVSPPPPPPPPTRISVDLYVEPKQPPDPAAVETPERAAEIALANPPLIEHLREIDGRYAGRRLPRLRWTAIVQRVPPIPEDPAQTAAVDAAAKEPPYWRVDVTSQDVRQSSVFYTCELRISLDGTRLDAVSSPPQLCHWQR
jgi:hypothetical protein